MDSLHIEGLKMALLARDPCKRCLIRAICSDACYQKEKYDMLTEGMPILYRFCAIAVLCSIVFAVLHAFMLIYSLFE
jgi:hypothetical protein